jgi:hypothetical protein
MNTNEALKWVMKNMPSDASQALAKFISVNPGYRGAGWDDCLERLLDADAHLNVTEPLYEDEGLKALGALPAAVAITCLYASRAFAEADSTSQRIVVKATIENNDGWDRLIAQAAENDANRTHYQVVAGATMWIEYGYRHEDGRVTDMGLKYRPEEAQPRPAEMLHVIAGEQVTPVKRYVTAGEWERVPE